LRISRGYAYPFGLCPQAGRCDDSNKGASVICTPRLFCWGPQ
jgi:hypothetical protein